ncbi:MAG: Piwi domain-containing protein, partial [Bacteroidota bacterium]|nr:Piwi domain-containing protein [Bacteroidota bacterium]
ELCRENFFFYKQFYNRLIKIFFSRKNLIVKSTFIGDVQIWILNNTENKDTNCDCFDRITIKVDYNELKNRPQLVISLDRKALVLKSSVKELLSSPLEDPFSETSATRFTLSLIHTVLYIENCDKSKSHRKKFLIDRYTYLAENQKHFNSENAFPVVNRDIAEFLNLAKGDEDDSENIGQHNRPKNRYPRYFDKINAFYTTYLNNDEFRSLIPISIEGFSQLLHTQIGQVNPESRELIFGGGNICTSPIKGVNFGPYSSPSHSNIQLIFIFPKEQRDLALKLQGYLLNGYKGLYKGIKKHTGRDIILAPRGYHILLEKASNPLREIETLLDRELEPNVAYMAIYLSPVSKHTSDNEAKAIYYKIKNKLLAHRIESQFIEIDKMTKILESDSKADHLKNFAYTLLNIAVTACAKLGGIPWKLNVVESDELVIGIGAFKSAGNKNYYIGSAFLFDNTGAFKSYEAFQKDQLKELAGSIENAIRSFTTANGTPNRIIIHFYKEMSLNNEYPHIEHTLNRLGLNIPVYIVTINKTVSKDYVVFDTANKDLMPYSGRYINLGNNTYLLCNNTRYEGMLFNPSDGFHFPIKLKINCPTDNPQPIALQIINILINQVYQFSRIYLKSVKQQPLPVTIKYPEMIAQLFQQCNCINNDSIVDNHLPFL